MANFASIPTNFGGVQYRSRLEAHWAAFFDRFGFKHQYEPFDLHGWIPDFLLRGNGNMLVEVKPYELCSDFTSCFEYYIRRRDIPEEDRGICMYPKEVEAWFPAIDKIIEADPLEPVLLVGNSIFTNTTVYDDSDFHLVGIRLDLRPLKCTTMSVLDSTPPVLHGLDMPIIFQNMNFFGRGDERVIIKLPLYPQEEIKGIWNETAAIVQWKGLFA